MLNNKDNNMEKNKVKNAYRKKLNEAKSKFKKNKNKLKPKGAIKVTSIGEREEGYLYWVDKNGDVYKKKLNRGRKKAK